MMVLNEIKLRFIILIFQRRGWQERLITLSAQKSTNELTLAK
jgi:hypothetical protein